MAAVAVGKRSCEWVMDRWVLRPRSLTVRTPDVLKLAQNIIASQNLHRYVIASDRKGARRLAGPFLVVSEYQCIVRVISL